MLPTDFLDKYEAELGFIVLQNPDNLMLFDTRKMSRASLTKALDRADVEAGTAKRETRWHDQILEVNWAQPTPETKPMSNVTGIQPGAFQNKLTEMRQKIADKQTEALSKIDGAVTSGAAKMNAAVDDVITKADKEVDAALHEFAQFTNGGPA